ncbi:MAG: hypothetical protein R3F56_22900 [Planctomycetota bacterium]
MRGLVLPIVVACAALAAPPRDEWEPFQDRREVSASGLRYAVVRETRDFKLAYELCRRRDGVAPMTAAPGPRRGWPGGEPPPIGRDPMDSLVVEGKLDQLPMQVHVADTFDGLLLFDHYASVGHGKIVRWIDDKGVLRAQHTLDDLFGRVPLGARRTVSSIWWSRHVSIDDERRTAVVVACDDELREVAFGDGAITTPGRAQVLAWCERGPASRRAAMLEVVGRWPAGAADLAAPTLLRVLQGEDEDMALRCRAATALRTLGSIPVGHDLAMDVFTRGRSRGQATDTRGYALANLALVAGDAALPILRELLATEKSTLWHDVSRGLVSLGPSAVPSLREMMFEADKPVHFRAGAAAILGEIRDARAVESLLRAAAEGEEQLVNSALNAVVAIAPPDLGERLISLLQAGTRDDARIVLYFRSHPTPAAVSALEVAARRFAAGTTERGWVDEALARCRKE